MVTWLCRKRRSRTYLISKNKCPILWLLSFIAQFYVSTGNTVHDIAKIQFSPSYIHNLLEGQNASVNVKVKFDEDEFVNSIYFNKSLKISVKTLHDEIATSDIAIIGIDPSDLKGVNGRLEYSFDTNIVSHFMGKTALQVRLISVDGNNNATSRKDVIEFMELTTVETQDFGSELKPIVGVSRMDLWVIREKDYTIWEAIFVAILILLIIVANFLMGCELKVTNVWGTIKSPIPPLIGCFSQFICMPLLAYIIAVTVLLPLGLNSFALGLFVTGCSPSGGASNFWTLLLEGNVNLSITMTFLSTIASIALIPFWMNILGHRFLQGIHYIKIVVPYKNIFTALGILVIPLLFGVIVAKVFPKFSQSLRSILRPFIIFILLFIIIFGTVLNFHLIHVMTWSAIIAGAILPCSGFIVGCLISLILGQKYENIVAISVETGVQNTGIAIMLLKFSFASPDADISALMPVIVACFTLFPLLIVLGIRFVYKKLKPLNDSTDSQDGNFSFRLIPGTYY
uniref:Uncharacterized protein n=1 Tax=Panagrolaimus superbus TaxID=310955 RepID=A0A914XTA3_9BILA